MYNQTTANVQNRYFTSNKVDSQQIKPFNRLVSIKKAQSDALLCFNQPVRITEHKGLALLVVTHEPDQRDTYHSFILQDSITLKPHTYFNTLALSPDCQVYLEPTNNEDPQIIAIKDRIKVEMPPATLDVQTIYGLHHQVYSNGESLPRSPHAYYELLIVDHGEIEIEVNHHTRHRLGQHYAWVNYPGQKYRINFTQDGMATLISILFKAQGLPDTISQRPMILGHRQLQIIERIIRLSNQNIKQMPFFYDEMLTSLQLVMVQMVNTDASHQEGITSSMRENYESETFQEIINFLEANVQDQHQVNDLVDHFNISRSSLQALFNKYTGQTPKAYINSLRLKRSKLMIHDSKYTLSEIASQLGYGSIQYFSRAFSKEFGISPSNYAKSIVK
ncbi:helix-turn-helix domain-containing protein [Facklamia languida]